MKKTFAGLGIVVMMMAAPFFAGCSSDDEGSVVGNWMRFSDKFQYYGSEYEDDNYGATYSIANAEGMALVYVTFNEDNTGLKVSEYAFPNRAPDSTNFSYSIDGDIINVVYVNHNGETKTRKYEVKKLTNNRLVLFTTSAVHGYSPVEHVYWVDHTFTLIKK